MTGHIQPRNNSAWAVAGLSGLEERAGEGQAIGMQWLTCVAHERILTAGLKPLQMNAGPGKGSFPISEGWRPTIQHQHTTLDFTEVQVPYLSCCRGRNSSVL